MSSSKGEAESKGKAAAEDDEDEKPPDPQPVTVSRLRPCIMYVYSILQGRRAAIFMKEPGQPGALSRT